MRRGLFVSCALSAAFVSSLLVGCGGSSGGGGGGLAASTAATQSGSTATSTSGSPAATTSSAAAGVSSAAPTTPGTPGPTGPDTAPPEVVLTSPTRGQHTTQAQVLVEGTVTDQTGVAYFLLNGQPVLPGAGGAFREVVTLTPGLNVIELEAADPLGQRRRTVVPVVSGQFLPEASVVGDALAVRMNRPAFQAIERVAAQQLGGQNLGAMILAQNPLYTGSAGLADVQVDATGASFGTPALTLDPQQGSLRVRAELPAIDVRVRCHGQVIGIPYGVNVSVTATRAILVADAVVSVGAQGQVTTALQNVQVTLDGFRFDIGGIPTFLENLARDAVRRLIERQVQRQVEQVVPAEINRAIAGANGPITQLVMGRPVTLHLIPRAVAFDPQGCSIATDGDLTTTPLPGLALPTTPGSLATPGARPTHGTTPAVHMSINDDFLNRIGHAAWRSGLTHLVVNQATAVQAGMPAWLPLDAFLLQLFFPSIASQLNGSDPIEIEVGQATPFMFQTRPAPGLIEASVGDMTVSIYVAPAGRPRQLVLRAGTQVRVPVAPALVPGPNGTTLVRIDVTGRPLIKTDVFEAPLGQLPEVAIETFFDFVMPPVIQLLPRAWSGFPLPTYPGLVLSNVQGLADGPSQDFVTIRGDL